MTIYLLKYTQEGTQKKVEAFSSFRVAQKRLTEISKIREIEVHGTEDLGPIHVLQPKNQKDVIDLLNSLF